MISRAATFETDEEVDDAVRLEVEALARRWSELSTEIEHEGFDAQARAEDGLDHEPEFDDDEDAAKYYAAQRVRDELRQRELRSIEEALAERRARMMRPYEHWNEDERAMEYSERDR